jgi:hypothetical protein
MMLTVGIVNTLSSDVTYSLRLLMVCACLALAVSVTHSEHSQN